jgi:molybdate/tungstate transport system substrate-binding protein
MRLSLGTMIAVALLTPWTAMAQTSLEGPLIVFNAGSLAKPFNDLLQEFRRRHPEVKPAQENSGSLEAARKLTELGKIPDVIGVADYGVISKILIPEHAGWYATFARNAMVLIYTDESIGAGEINGQNWWQVLLRPGVRAGRSEPTLDPNGYRTLMAFQLAESFYRQPGLARRLEHALGPRKKPT